MTFNHPKIPNSANIAQRFKSSLGYWLCVILAIAALSPRIVQLLGTANVAAASSTTQISTTISDATRPRLVTKPIEDIRCGDRIPSELPEGLQPENDPEPDPATWRLVELEVEKADGSKVEVNLLRPLTWLKDAGAVKSGTFHLNVNELNIDGEAAVLRILPCPTIQSGEGRVVTGTFSHRSDSLVELHIAGEPEPIICTSGHPIWSEHRRQFVAAADLIVNERLKSFRNDDARVSQVLVLASNPQPVFNFEVCATHVYSVGLSGILVHNATFQDCEKWANKRQKAHEKQGKPSEKILIDGKGNTTFRLPNWEGENDKPYRYHFLLLRDGKVFDQGNGRGIDKNVWWQKFFDLNGADKIRDLIVPDGF